MVNRKSIKKYALISVYDKSKLKYLCSNLIKFNYKFISTGNTSSYIKKLGFKTIHLEKITKFKEILDGRVKTLHPKIHSSILYKRDVKSQIDEFEKLNVPEISLVVVNLYPFKNFSRKKINKYKIIEMIDIGGSTLIRSAAKNFKHVNIISQTRDYKVLIDELSYSGETSINFRKKMAMNAFKISSNYESTIYKWFSKIDKKYENNIKKIKYGENSNQSANISIEENNEIFNNKIQGKDIGYNNIIDIDSGINCINEFSEPTCLIIKHTNPCGAASTDNILKSFKLALKTDKKSAFGGVVLFNRKVTKKLALEINENFFEVIIAIDFEIGALEVFQKKTNLIVIKIKNYKINKNEFRSTIFGTLNQKKDIEIINKKIIKLVSKKKVNKKQQDDLLFALKVVKHLKSNAIALVKNKQLVGVGCGQTSRIDALKTSISKMKENFGNIKFVCASDAFFPFDDGIKFLNKQKCEAIVQPFGSKNDIKIINYAVNNSIPLYFSKNRYFKH